MIIFVHFVKTALGLFLSMKIWLIITIPSKFVHESTWGSGLSGWKRWRRVPQKFIDNNSEGNLYLTVIWFWVTFYHNLRYLPRIYSRRSISQRRNIPPLTRTVQHLLRFYKIVKGISDAFRKICLRILHKRLLYIKPTLFLVDNTDKKDIKHVV